MGQVGLSLLLLAAAVPSSLALQSSLAIQPIEQLPSAAGDSGEQGVDQVGAASRDVAGSARPAPAESRAPAQLTSDAQAANPTPQLSRPDDSAPAPVQLNRGGRTAQAPDALSTPTQGRRGDQAAVGGRDRCDQVLADRSADPAFRAACARVIETRSAEFVRPDPTILSPEQRILVEQRLREDRNVQRTPNRRMADGAAADPDDLESQEVASIVLGRPAAPAQIGAEADAQEVDAQAQAAAALVQAIINGGRTGPR